MATPTEHQLIFKIAHRAADLYDRLTETKVNPAYIASEIWIVHCEVCKLRLQDFLDADDANFAHDISGIHRHLDIGKPCRLTDGFTPRFAVRN